jgi:hypothetical protein
MHGATPPFPQYAFMAWCSVKAQGQLYLYVHHSFARVPKLWLLRRNEQEFSIRDHENGGSKFLRNVGILPRNYMTSQPT